MHGAPLLRVELHAHSTYSHDGYIRLGTLLEVARTRKIDAIAITDHDTIEGAMEFQRAAGQLRAELEVIVGEERTLRDGSHLSGLFLRSAIQSTDFESAVREILDQGGICLIPHPYRHGNGLLNNLSPEAELSGLGFEIFNPKCSYEENTKAHCLLGRLTPLGGSDAHFESDLANCLNVFPFEQDLRTSLARVVSGQSPVQVLGVAQRPGGRGRRYAPLYQRVKPYVHLPRSFMPAAKEVYRLYRNAFNRLDAGKVEVKYSRV